MSEIVLCNTECGQIKGIREEDHVSVFKGIRYATAGRWEYPKEVTSWEGIYDATRFADSCIQKRTFYPETEESFYYREFRRNDVYTYSEDCQFLNIWKPEECEDAPVILYIHGGAFQAGSGSEGTFDGSKYAKKGIIFVTCNYRLGVLGFCSHPYLAERDGHTGNYGLFDQLTALKWLYHNIRSFGGNPEKITLMGQSAGAMSIQQLCDSELAKPYISKAIMTSGGGIGREFARFVPQEEAMKFWDRVLKKLGNSLEEWLETDAEELIAITEQFVQEDMKSIDYMMPVKDDVLICRSGDEVAEQKKWAEIPYLLGATKDDMLPEVLGKMAKEWIVLQSECNKIPSYCFRFERNLPGDDKGAWHSSDLWYTIGNLEKSWRPFEKWDYTLSDQMMEYYANFVKSGNPNGDGLTEWKPTRRYEDPVMYFSDDDVLMKN